MSSEGTGVPMKRAVKERMGISVLELDVRWQKKCAWKLQGSRGRVSKKKKKEEKQKMRDMQGLNRHPVTRFGCHGKVVCGANCIRADRKTEGWGHSNWERTS